MSTQSTQSHYFVFPPNFSEPLLSVGFPSVAPFLLPADPSSGARATSRTGARRNAQDGRKKGTNVSVQCRRKELEQKNVRAYGKSYRHVAPIDTLPDEVLLEIFDFWDDWNWDHMEEWQKLVHVCQRWRQIVFSSQYRLRLDLLCKPGTPVRKYLGIWPALPIYIDYIKRMPVITPGDEDNIVAALEHPHRVRALELYPTGSLWEKVSTMTTIQEPFPVLYVLMIRSGDRNTPILPTKFLGGSAPCLQEIHFHGISVPALPTLLLSASGLRVLYLMQIPPTGYISPEVMVACLAALPMLHTFNFGFRLVTSRPMRIHPPPITRTVLPALICLSFQGASEYLEDFVAQIDCPQLKLITITYFNQVIDFQVAQLSKLVSRSVGRKPTLFKHTHITFSSDKVSFHPYTDPHPFVPLYATIRCEGIDWQVSHMAQALSYFSAILSHVIHVKLELELEKGRQLEGTGDVEWQLLLYRFSAVQTLHVSQNLAGHIARALEDMPAGGMFAESLPSLDLLFLEGQPESSVEKFVAARQRSDRPVTIVDTKTEFDERLASKKEDGSD